MRVDQEYLAVVLKVHVEGRLQVLHPSAEEALSNAFPSLHNDMGKVDTVPVHRFKYSLFIKYLLRSSHVRILKGYIASFISPPPSLYRMLFLIGHLLLNLRVSKVLLDAVDYGHDFREVFVKGFGFL